MKETATESQIMPRPANATLRQAAEYLQLTDRTIQNLVYRGLLKPVYFGRRRFFRWSELHRLAKHGVKRISRHDAEQGVEAAS